MPRRWPPHVEAFRDRHGRLRVYFRRGKGARFPLPNDPNSPEFGAAYGAAMAGKLPELKPSTRVTPGTLGSLVVSYKASLDYRSLRETTRTGYAWRLRHIEDNHGHRTLAGMNRQNIEAKILMPFADKPGQRLSILKMLRILIRHANAVGMLATDPSKGIRRPKSSEIRSWTDTEIEAFRAHWPVGTAQRLAFDLMLYTGQRRSDVHRMTWADLTPAGIRVVQQKTGAKLTIKVHPALAATLATATREHVAIMATAHGAMRTVDGFSTFMRDAIAKAGLPLECQPHGLRKAAGRMLAEAGCSAHQIMSVLGHRTLAEAERYTREADQVRLNASAIDRLAGQKANETPQTYTGKFGETLKKAKASR